MPPSPTPPSCVAPAASPLREQLDGGNLDAATSFVFEARRRTLAASVLFAQRVFFLKLWGRIVSNGMAQDYRNRSAERCKLYRREVRGLPW
jgi:hypothetical protein